MMSENKWQTGEPPEPEKPPIQEACEWLGASAEPMVWEQMAKPATNVERLVYDALLWRIETELNKRLETLLVEHTSMQRDVQECWSVGKAGPYHLECERELGIAGTRGEALIKAALWLKEQEDSNG